MAHIRKKTELEESIKHAVPRRPACQGRDHRDLPAGRQGDFFLCFSYKNKYVIVFENA